MADRRSKNFPHDVYHQFRRITCPFCPLTFVHGRDQRLHEQKVHRRSTATLFVCEACNKKFNRQRDLRRHVEYVHRHRSSETTTAKLREVVRTSAAKTSPTTSSDDALDTPVCSVDIPEEPIFNVVSVVSTETQTVEPCRQSVLAQTDDVLLPLDYMTMENRSRRPPPPAKRRLFVDACAPSRGVDVACDTSDRPRLPQVEFRKPSVDQTRASFVQISAVRLLSEADAEMRELLCDCESCVEHAIGIRSSTLLYQQQPRPRAVILRFCQLPGRPATCPPSSMELQDELRNRLYIMPDTERWACSCRSCVGHRALLLAWRECLLLAKETPL